MCNIILQSKSKKVFHLVFSVFLVLSDLLIAETLSGTLCIPTRIKFNIHDPSVWKYKINQTHAKTANWWISLTTYPQKCLIIKRKMISSNALLIWQPEMKMVEHKVRHNIKMKGYSCSRREYIAINRLHFSISFTSSL